MATATAKKPAPAKPAGNVKPPAAKAAAGKGVTVAKPAKTPAAPKEVAPFEPGTIVTFKGYATAPPEGTDLIAEGTELAVVGQRVDQGMVYVACVAPQDYHRYMADPNSDTAPDGNEFAPTEIKRTSKKVEEPFELIAIGDYQRMQEAFFYRGGTFAELWQGKADDEVTPIFATYERPEGAPAPDDAQAVTETGGYAPTTAGFELFLAEHFPGVGGVRKAKELIGIYTTFSALPNAADIVKKLPEIGWWKAGMLRSYVTDENAAELVEAASEHTVPTLRAHLKETYVTEDGKSTGGKTVNRVVIKRTTYSFQLFEDRGTGVTMILEAAAKQLGITDQNALFEHIITEWAGGNLGPEAVAKANAAATKKTEALVKSGVKLPESHPSYKAPEKAAAAPVAEAPKPIRGGKLPARPVPAKPVATAAA